MEPRQGGVAPTIVFFGTAGFGLTHNSSGAILDKLVKAGYKPAVLVTAPDMPVGRKQELTPPPAKISAQKYSIPVFQPSSLKNFKAQIASYKPDLIILAAYGRIIPKEILGLPKYGALCIHPSLLPKFRGPSPVQNTILEGEKKTGVTIILMDDEVDHGPIVAQKEIPISNFPTTPELSEKLAELGGDLLVETISNWVSKEIEPQEQDHAQATYTKLFSREDGHINWLKPASYIERQVRAFNPWPGAYAVNGSENSKTVKMLKVSVLETQDNATRKPGEAFLTQDKKLAIQTGDNALLVEQLQLEGGKPMSAKDFLLGHRDFIGTILL